MNSVLVKDGLTLAKIKIIAYLTMLIDHIAECIYLPYLKLTMTGAEAQNDLLYICMRIVGRMAFPLFCFMLIEGIRHSRSRRNYLVRLFVMAVVSEPCFDLALSGRLWDASSQNVCITLFIMAIMLILFERYERTITNILGRLCAIAATIIVAATCTYILKTDFNISGVIIVTAIYYLRPYLVNYLDVAIVLSSIGIYLSYFVKYFIKYPSHRIDGIDWQWYINKAWTLQMWVPLSLIIIRMYYGKKGRTLPKLFYYGFYPVHLLVLGIISKILF